MRKASIFLTLFLALSFSSVAFAESAEEAKSILQKKCFGCHSLGQGPRMASDLKGVTERFDKAWVKQMILDPAKLFNAGDTQALELLQKYNNIRMPSLGLSDGQADAIVSYLDSYGKEVAPAAAHGDSHGGAHDSGHGSGHSSGTEDSATDNDAAAEASSAVEEVDLGLDGNALIGEKLFNGSKKFENGGASCISCHAMKGVGFLGGGTLGTDLSSTYKKYGAAGLVPMLKSLPFPSMKPIYENKKLTDEEVAHLKEYFKLVQDQASSEEDPEPGSLKAEDTNLLFFGLGFGLFIALLLLAQVIWRDRLKGVRKNMVQDAKEKLRKERKRK